MAEESCSRCAGNRRRAPRLAPPRAGGSAPRELRDGAGAGSRGAGSPRANRGSARGPPPPGAPRAGARARASSSCSAARDSRTMRLSAVRSAVSARVRAKAAEILERVLQRRVHLLVGGGGDALVVPAKEEGEVGGGRAHQHRGVEVGLVAGDHLRPLLLSHAAGDLEDQLRRSPRAAVRGTRAGR